MRIQQRSWEALVKFLVDIVNTDLQQIQRAARIGVEHCRRGDWDKGLQLLGLVAESDLESLDLPGICFSYLGYGVAEYEGKVREGLALCKHAVKVQFYEPDNYLNLAEVELLRGNRRKTMRAIRRGLKLDPNHRDLRRLLDEMGLRRRPIVPFLGRRNLLNRLLGQVRHQFRQS